MVRVKADVFGTVEWLDAKLKAGQGVDQGQPLCHLAACQHPVVMKDMCADCGCDLRAAGGPPGQRKLPAVAAIPMIHSVPELHVAPDVARSHAVADVKRLVSRRKLALLIDLDQTVLHTTNELVPNDLKDVHHYRLYGAASQWYHTHIRPGAIEVLHRLGQIYELHIATFGQRAYAHCMASLLDAEGKGIFAERILSRDECFDPMMKTANLSALFPCGDYMAVIIDDRLDVWQHAKNAVQVKAYRYFRTTGDINAPPGAKDSAEKASKPAPDSRDAAADRNSRDKSSSADVNPESQGKQSEKALEGCIEEPIPPCEANPDANASKGAPVNEKSENSGYEVNENDGDYMTHLEDILVRIHKAYYEVYDLANQCGKGNTSDKKYDDMPLSELLSSSELDEGKPQPGTSGDGAKSCGVLPDTKMIVPLVRRRTLSNCNLVLSGMVPAAVDPRGTAIYKSVVDFGASVQPDLVLPGAKGKESATTHVVAAKWGTSKVHIASRHPSIHIVSPNWLSLSIERWHRANETEFALRPSSAPFDVCRLPLHLSGRTIVSSNSAPSLQDGERTRETTETETHPSGTLPKSTEESENPDKIVDQDSTEEHVHFSMGELESMEADFDKEMSSEIDELSGSESGDGIDPAEESDGESPKCKKRKRSASSSDENNAKNNGNNDSDNDEYNESIGSVDDDMADAVEDFLNDSGR